MSLSDMDSGTWSVDIVSDSLSASDLLSRVQKLDDLSPRYAFEVRRPRFQFRAVDAAVLVALIGAVGSTLTALIAGLLQVCQRKADQRISIELASGTKVQIPANVSVEELERILQPINEPARKILLP
jgi:hypothetical protein